MRPRKEPRCKCGAPAALSPNKYNYNCAACEKERHRTYRARNAAKIAERRRSDRACLDRRRAAEAARRRLGLDRDKRRAHATVRYLIQRGLLRRQPCEACGSEKAHAHHDDYGRPHDVRWLCPLHHKAVHRGVAV